MGQTLIPADFQGVRYMIAVRYSDPSPLTVFAFEPHDRRLPFHMIDTPLRALLG
jgi:hypothetical protein